MMKKKITIEVDMEASIIREGSSIEDAIVESLGMMNIDAQVVEPPKPKEKPLSNQQKIHKGFEIIQNYSGPDLELKSDWDGSLFWRVWVPLGDLVDESDKKLLADLDWEYDEEEEIWYTEDGDSQGR
jgi:hypothetical protein